MKHADFTDDRHQALSCNNPFCKVHWYWDFESEDHMPYPYDRWWKDEDGTWWQFKVFVGPPAYFPKKPTPDLLRDMQMICPHTQMDLTCNTCLRHTFRPMEI